MSGGLKGVRGSVGLGLTAVSKWLLSSEQRWDDGAWQTAQPEVIWEVAGLNLHSKRDEHGCQRVFYISLFRRSFLWL